MGIYIKGMEMPTARDTLVLVKTNGTAIVYGEDETYMTTAVPVPPHGDLIDRSKLYEKTAEWEAQALHMVATTMNDEDESEWRKWSTVLTERSAFKFDVADAPTIISAEED